MAGQTDESGNAAENQEHYDGRKDTKAPENYVQNTQDLHVLRHAPSAWSQTEISRFYTLYEAFNMQVPRYLS